MPSPSTRSSNEPESQVNQPNSRRLWNSRKFIYSLISIILLAGVFMGAAFWPRKPGDRVPSNIKITGRIEGDESHISSAKPGRVTKVLVKEGEHVSQGELILVLDDKDLRAKQREADSAVAMANESEREALIKLQGLERELSELQTQSKNMSRNTAGAPQSANTDSPGSPLQEQSGGPRGNSTGTPQSTNLSNPGPQTQIQSEGSSSAPQEANLSKEALQMRSHSKGLFRNSAAAKLRAEMAQMRMQMLAQSQRSSASMATILQQLKANDEKLRTEIDAARAGLSEAREAVLKAKAARDEISTSLDDYLIKSPIDGVCVMRNVEPGDLVAPGLTLLSLLDLQSVYFKGFIPEGEVGNVIVGQQARVFLDSSPHKPLSAKVTSVDEQASFTPANIYFKQDRVKQVFGIRLDIANNTQLLAKPGMPADAEIVRATSAAPRGGRLQAERSNYL